MPSPYCHREMIQLDVTKITPNELEIHVTKQGEMRPYEEYKPFPLIFGHGSGNSVVNL